MSANQGLAHGRASLRLMPLGGSVTQGVGSSHGTGYRQPLLEMFRAHGITITMVGSRQTGSMPHHHHEGWRGFRIDEIDRKARKSTPRLQPDIFTVNAGSNDCLQAFKIDSAGDRMEAMLEYLWHSSPRSTVLLSTLLVSADPQVDLLVRRVNEQFRALAEQKLAERKKIVLADMYTADGPSVDCLVDGIHPDDGGYERMAKLWFDAFQEAQQKGFIRKR